MPDIIVHTSMGKRVLESSELKLNEDLFYLGCFGPDPFLFYHFLVGRFNSRINKWSSVMHEKDTGDFLVELTNSNSDISYVAGFLCHYALDASVHPLVNRYVGDEGYMHMAIEHRLEIMDGGDFIFPQYMDLEMERTVGSVIEKVYGFQKPMKYFRKGYRDLKLFSRIVKDKHRILCRIFKKGKLAVLSYHTNLADDFDLSEFIKLKEQAIEQACQYIQAVISYRNDEISENELRKIIGNRSYSG